MVDFEREKNILRQLIIVRKAVKRKYDALKFEKENFQKAISETFKPIVDPLHELLEVSKKKKISHEKQKSSEMVKEVIDDNLIETSSDDDDDDLSTNNTIRHVTDSEFETADSGEESDNFDKYIFMLNDDQSNIDKIYGVRKEGKDYIIGDSFIYFKNQFIKVKDVRYPKTQGLMELLITKHPDRTRVTSSDMKNYRYILEATNAHKKQYRNDGAIRSHISKKYTEIIAPLFSEKEGGSVPRYEVSQGNAKFDVYWDNPNKLVDRLRLLVAEREAGNSSHINEIHSIVKELREAGYIY